MSDTISIAQLAFRSYLVPSGAFDGVVISGPCLVDGLYMTTAPIAPATYTFFDAMTSGGTVLFNGTTALIGASAMRVRAGTGLYLLQAGAGTLPQWVIIAAQLPDPDVLVVE